MYNDDRVKKHFELKPWVDISEIFDISMATKTVLTAVTDDHPASESLSYDNKDLDWLQNRLKEDVNIANLCQRLENYPPSKLFISNNLMELQVCIKSFTTNGKFASLESLSFSLTSTWKEWNLIGVGVKDGEVFPKLQELCIGDCDQLITGDLPSDLVSLPKLLVIGRTKEAIIESLLLRTQVLQHLELGECKKVVMVQNQ
ncbi:hypothetical protein FEM48_Zijuj10G0009300 [Ziziphus jujuba var. spinosa]|uniref:Disease resistance RPP13-like protein 1 n=1 Tax=Ziziphus jujuba var. spinosa TaxID=714518 RepID=A0A978UKC1_ZIZJJ|nr:hypothetical protein FEM48_Zijuj10G0009300 [Ziziphus jujuba var. spinosa]